MDQPPVTPSPSNVESTFGLAREDIREFRDICRAEATVMTDDEAADAARRVVILYRMLLGRIPEDPAGSAQLGGSNTAPLSLSPPGKVD